jgi:nucleotide-binding universal stress UspA family protein
MKKVLIALDYDPTAQKVAEAGFALSKSMKVEVTLLHVVASANYYSSLEYSPITGFAGYIDMNPLKLESDDWVKDASGKFLDKIKKHLDDKNIKTVVKEGDAADAILKTAKELHADIIVIGSHSRRWIEEILIGSVTEKVLHNTSIPLFIIPVKNPR